MRRLGAVIVRLRWAIIAFWILAPVAAVALGPEPPALEGIEVTALVPEDTPALEVARAEVEEFRFPLVSQATGVIRAPEPLTAEQTAAIYAGAASATFQGGFDPVVIAAPLVNTAQWEGLSRGSGTTALVYMTMRPETGLARQVDTAQRLTETLAPPGAYAGVTGAAPAQLEQGEAIADALGPMTLLTLAVVLVAVMAWFRAVLAPVVLLVAAGVAYLCVTHTTAWLAGFGIPYPGEAEPLVIALVLGVTVDYGVFLMHGARGAMARGEPARTAAAEAVQGHGLIVIAASLTIAGGAAALFAAKLEFLRDLAPALAVAAPVSALVALTLVPAVTAVLGERLFWPSGAGRPRRGFAPARLLAGRRGAAGALVVGIAVLGVLAAPLSTIRLDVGLISGLPRDSTPQVAAAEASQGFAAGAIAPATVLVRGQDLDRRGPALVAFEAALRTSPGVVASLGPVQVPPGTPRGFLVSDSGDAARFVVIFEDEPLGPQAVADIRRLEDRLPAMLRDAGLAEATAAVGGYTALADATTTAVVSDLGRVAAALLALTVVLVAIFLRSVVAALLLVAGSCLALLAALGFATWMIEDGFDRPGFPYYVPLAATVLLITLGADYAIFFAGRIWQRSRRMGLERAVDLTVTHDSDALWAAGTALALSFAALAVVPVLAFQALGLVMAVGVALDTFVIRPVLFPAVLRLIGRRAGWPGAGLEPDRIPYPR